MMLTYSQRIEEINFELNRLEAEKTNLKKQLKKINEDKVKLKQKRDFPALERLVRVEKDIIRKIDFTNNEIKLLNRKLTDLQNEKRKCLKTEMDMHKVIKQLELGYTLPQASKRTLVSLSKIHKWMDYGKNNKEGIYVDFYNQMKDIDEFNFNFFNVLKAEFDRQNEVSLLSAFVPKSYSRRMVRFYKNDSSIWFSRLELRDESSLYYFGLTDDVIPRLILNFDKSSKKSYFRLHDGEVHIKLKIRDADNLKVIKISNESGWYYVSLGKLKEGKLSQNLESLIKNHHVRYNVLEENSQ